MRGVLGEGGRWGGPQGGGPSWRSWQMSLPSLQMHPSRSPHEEQGLWLGDKAACNPRQWRGNGRDWTEVRASKTLKRTSHRPVASALTHATQNIASKPAREQERAARPTRRAEREGTYTRKKKNSGRPKEEVPNKIKARASAWRNKRNKNRKWRHYKDQSKR